MEKLVFFDLETGGLNPQKHPVIEIAAITVDAKSFRELDRFSVGVQYNIEHCNVRSLGKKFHAKEWRDSSLPDIASAKLFATFLERHATYEAYSSRSRKPFRLARLVAHNGEQFDAPFIHHWFRRLGLYCPAARMCLCTKQKALWFFQENPSLSEPKDYKLGTLCKYFNTKTQPTHHALVDTEATIELYRTLLNISTGLNVEQRDYLVALSKNTGLSHQQLINMAINGIAYSKVA